MGTGITAQQTQPLQVTWAYPNGGQAMGGAAAFAAIGFNEPINPSTVNTSTVQLAYQRPTGGWSIVPESVSVNPGNNTIVVVPKAVQPSGVYLVAIYPQVQSTTGSSLGSPYYTSYSIHDSYNPPGGPSSVTVVSPANGEQVSTFAGVIVADQLRALDRSSVNGNTVQLFHVNPDGSQGALVPTTVHYDPEIPSIEVAVTVALTQGNYRFVINGVRDLAGNAMAQPFVSTFTVTRNQVAPGPDILQNTPIAVGSTYPQDGQVSTVTAVAAVFFNQEADASTVNTNTIQLARWLPAQNRFSGPLPITVTNNPTLHSVALISEQGLQEGNYVIAVRGVKDLLGRTMTGTQYFHYTFFNATNPPVDGRVFAPYPANASTVSGVPPALLVYFQKFAGDLAWSVNSSTVQLHPWVGNSMGGPIPVTVTYNPWPGLAVLVPQQPLGDGVYVITVNGIVDVAGNVQRTGFSSWFNVTNTGRPQTIN